MKLFTVVFCTSMVCATPSWAQISTKNTVCENITTIKSYKTYASKVYKRKFISQTAKNRLVKIIKCQYPKSKVKFVRQWKTKYLRDRANGACSIYNVKACIRLAANKYKVSYSWLLACAKSESGLRWNKMNSMGSGAGGLFQFMKSTYKATLKRMGIKTKSFFDPYWQSMAAAWKFRHDGSGEWTAPGC